MKNKLTGLILVLFMTGCTTNTEMSSALKATSNESVSEMKIYDQEGIKSFIEHGTGVVLLEGKDQNSSDAEEILKKATDENEITPAVYKVSDVKDDDLIYLVNSHNVSRIKLLNDSVETPLLLFVEDGMIQTYFMADDFENEEVKTQVEESISSLSDYMKANGKDACDSGCKLGE